MLKASAVNKLPISPLSMSKDYVFHAKLTKYYMHV